MKVRLALAALSIVVSSAPARGAEADAELRDTRQVMHEIAGELSAVLPELATARDLPGEGGDQALRRIAARADELERHAAGRDPGFAFRARSLGDDARTALARLEAGRRREAAHFTLRLVDSCIACHSRLPDERGAPLARRLLRPEVGSALSTAERARLALATRRFDEALDLWETAFADPTRDLAGFDAARDLTLYLETAVRVRGSFDRAAATLDRLGERADVPLYLARRLAAWRESVPEAQRALRGRPTIARVERLLAAADSRRTWPGERSGLVLDLAAASAAHRVLEDDGLDAVARAHVYVLLGQAEARIGESFWESEADALLEAAIRSAPESPAAERALALLEEHAVLAFSGSGGTHVPADVDQLLRELTSLVPAAGRQAAVERGAGLFVAHCASCHGSDGRGGGPVAAILTVPPADLTRLARRYGAELSWEEVEAIVAGTGEVRGHGAREMPVWGLTFREPGRDVGNEGVAEQKIHDVVEYIRTLQRD